VLGHEPTKEDWPVPGPWNHHSIKAFLGHKAADKAHPLGDEGDDQADGPAKIAALVALEAGKATLLDSVEAVTRLTQNNDNAVAYTQVFAKLLEKVILGGTVSEGLEAAQAFAKESGSDPATAAASGIAAAVAAAATEHAAIVAENGSSCAMPGSLSNAAHGLATAGTDFAASLRPTIAAPGCNCSRACMIGAVLGAALGDTAVPADWIAKTTQGAAAVEAATAVASL
jgi:ADP-ribosylglycohydrolase